MPCRHRARRHFAARSRIGSGRFNACPFSVFARTLHRRADEDAVPNYKAFGAFCIRGPQAALGFKINRPTPLLIDRVEFRID